MNRFATPAQIRASSIRWALVLAPLFLLMGAASGRLAGSGEDNSWFAALAKPALYPPPAVFPVVWSVLYVMMGVALALVVAARPSAAKGPAVFGFLKQFALNLAWSPVFFALHSITGALIVILAMLATLIFTMVFVARVNRLAAWLLAPYLAWLVFATGLTWQIRRDNPEADGARSATIALLPAGLASPFPALPPAAQAARTARHGPRSRLPIPARATT